jgi:serine/threonine protein kinase
MDIDQQSEMLEYLGFNSATRINIGVDNEVFLVESKRETFILRVNDLNAFEYFLKEKWCYNRAKELNIPSPKVISIGKYKNKSYMVLEYIKGNCCTNIKSEKLKQTWISLGKYAKTLSGIKVMQYSEIENVSNAKEHFYKKYLQYNFDLLNVNDPLISRGLYSFKESKAIKSMLEILFNYPLGFRLCHNDISLENCILGEDSKLYLIDYGSAQIGPTPWLEIFEMWMKFHYKGKFSIKEIEWFASGYGIEFQINEDVSLLKALTVLHLIDKIRWSLDNDKLSRFDYYSQVFKKIKSLLIR